MFNIGFSWYLTLINPKRRSWQWHLKNTIVLCTIHFTRGILKATGIERYPYSPYERIEALRTALSKEKCRNVWTGIYGQGLRGHVSD